MNEFHLPLRSSTNRCGCSTWASWVWEPRRTSDKLTLKILPQSKCRKLTFNDVTLEQADEQGRSVWKVKAEEAICSKDKKLAQVRKPTGELFQDGKPVYQIIAQQGTINRMASCFLRVKL